LHTQLALSLQKVIKSVFNDIRKFYGKVLTILSFIANEQELAVVCLIFKLIKNLWIKSLAIFSTVDMFIMFA
jgi:hypothetical protein